MSVVAAQTLGSDSKMPYLLQSSLLCLNTLFSCNFITRILYGADVWCSIPQGNCPGATEKGTARVQRKLTSIQRTGAIAITGALRTSPTDTLNACAFLPPMAYPLEKWSLRVVVWLATILPKHLLYKPVRTSSRRYTKWHRSLLHMLFKGFNHNTRNIEKIPPKPCNLVKRGKIPFTISIAVTSLEGW